MSLPNSYQWRIKHPRLERLSHVRSRHGGFTDFGSILCPDTTYFQKITFWKKVPKPWSKPGPNPGPWTTISRSLIRVFEGFFSEPSKSIIQTASVQQRFVTLHILFAKINYYPNERTNERTWPNLTLSDVKSASRNEQKQFKNRFFTCGAPLPRNVIVYRRRFTASMIL